MTSGFWLNQDGLPLQFGPLKAQPELGGDYLIYGETREVEQIISLVPYQLGLGGVTVPAAPTTFSGTGLPIAAGIQSMTQLFPMQVTAPVTTLTNSVLLLQAPQIFIEQVDVETLIGATGGTSINVGFAAGIGQIGATAPTFTQVNGIGTQILHTFPIAAMASVGQRATFTQANSITTAGFLWNAAAPTTTTGAGDWLGNMPQVTTTRADGNLVDSAFLSTIATGTFTNGLIKLRIRYTLYGNINY